MMWTKWDEFIDGLTRLFQFCAVWICITAAVVICVLGYILAALEMFS